jgi:hypothetical protein
MIPISSGVRVWIATGHTDMRKGMQGLSLLVQEGLGRDPFAGDVFVFRGRGGSLIKAIWHDGLGLSLYAIGHVPARNRGSDAILVKAGISLPSAGLGGDPAYRGHIGTAEPGASANRRSMSCSMVDDRGGSATTAGSTSGHPVILPLLRKT